MAEVLSPMVQQTGSITMLNPAMDAFQNNTSSQSQSMSSQVPINPVYNNQNSILGYRGTVASPVAAYAFQSTPQLKQGHRSYVSLSNSHMHQSVAVPDHAREYSSESATLSSQPISVAKVPIGISASASAPDLTRVPYENSVKAPDRYRRASRNMDLQPVPQQEQDHSVGTLVKETVFENSNAEKSTTRPQTAHHRTGSADDDIRQPIEVAKRYRRRSICTMDASGAVRAQIAATSLQVSNPTLIHRRSGSGNSTAPGNVRTPILPQDTNTCSKSSSSSSHGEPILTNVPSRGSSEANKRNMISSPLSASGAGVIKFADKPKEGANPLPTENNNSLTSSTVSEPFMQDRGSKMNGGMKKRLRRVLSFSGAIGLSGMMSNNQERENSKKEKFLKHQEAQHAAIVANQEAAGIGSDIYFGQGGFTGSTDNLSISSTASSASVMLRKMGNGMKKSTRSLKGLFRPKSIVTSGEDLDVVQTSVPQVSMVTVEAERNNTCSDGDGREAGKTGFPTLEKHFTDQANIIGSHSASYSRDSDKGTSQLSRKSIVGGDRERAEVLAAVKKGILKRSCPEFGNSSPVLKASDNQVDGLTLLTTLPHFTDSPNSSSPSTPVDDHPIRSFNIAGDNYFLREAGIGNSSTKSLPFTSNSPRNISFNSRIQFHDAWSSSEYDRRGDVATCNRLTPVLAQQIKEELNSFKMEMEVHELSKPYTHFF